MSDSDFERGFLERFMEIHGVRTDAELARKVGRSPSSVHNWRKRGNIPIDECIAVAKSTGASLDWLILGRGQREDGASVRDGAGAYRVDDGLPVPELRLDPDSPHCPVSLYDIEAAAGTGAFFEHERIEEVLWFDRAALAGEGLNPEHVVGIKVRGDSMDGTLADGDRVLVDFSQRRPDGVFLLRMGDELRIKRVQRLAGGALQLISDNEHYDKELIRPEDMREVEILGRCLLKIGRVM